MKCKIAVVQFNSYLDQPNKNLIKAEAFIKEASLSGADVIVFPEYFLTAPVWKRPDIIDSDFSFRKHFVRWAKEYKLDIVTGSFWNRIKLEHPTQAIILILKALLKVAIEK